MQALCRYRVKIPLITYVIIFIVPSHNILLIWNFLCLAEIMAKWRNDRSDRTSASSSSIRQHAGTVCGILQRDNGQSWGGKSFLSSVILRANSRQRKDLLALFRQVHGCVPAMGYSFAAGTTDGPGSFAFEQGTTTSNPFWNAVRNFLAAPTESDVRCQSPKPILLATGRVSLFFCRAHSTPWFRIYHIIQLMLLLNAIKICD